MLMSLLAGQAAVDCQAMPIGRWEEVEEWKNVSSRIQRHGILARGLKLCVVPRQELAMLTSRLSQSVARHQREQKILTAAKTLAKLNGANKRLSKQTVESLEVAEKKAAEAEKVGGMTTRTEKLVADGHMPTRTCLFCATVSQLSDGD
jgi:hypothetical protein